MSFQYFTSPTGLDQLAVDLYVVSDTGGVTNTRQNTVVRHNETNRFWVIPHQSNINAYNSGSRTWATYFNNYAAVASSSYTRHLITRVEFVGRPVASPAEQAFSVVVTAINYPSGENIPDSSINSINYWVSAIMNNSFASSATFGAQPICLVVTAMSSAVLELSRKSLMAGGDGSVPLVAQISSTVSAGFNDDPYKTRFLTVTTIFSKPFSLTYQAPLHRDPSY